MNILIVPSWYSASDGAQLGSFFREQALALKQMGNNVFVADATFQGISQLYGKKLFRLQKVDDDGLLTYSYLVPAFGITRTKKGGISFYYKNLKKLYQEILKDGHKIDVIHAHSFFPAGWAASKLGTEFNIPVVTTEHSSGLVARTEAPYRIQLLTETIENSDAFICVGNALKAAVIEYTNTKKNIIVIPNMVNSVFCFAECKDKKEKFVFATTGNLIERKRMDLVICAFARAFKGNKNVILKILGDGPLKNDLIELARTHDIYEQVDFTGRLERKAVASNLQSSNVFVLASDWESFGVVYVEALACGLPVIGTRNGGAEDIITKENGFLVEKNNVEQLSNAMKMIYTNFAHYPRKLISQQTIETYGGNAVCSEIMDVYKKVRMERR